MLSVAKLAPGREAYYEASVARGLDDYHAGRGEAPGVWAGAGAELLGLFGRVEHGQLGELISGVDPASGVRLRRHYPPRDIRVVRLDPDTGRRVASTRRLEPVGGFDLVFSVPKSASVLWALGDPRVRREVEAAHEAAWRSAVGYLEREACATRSGRNGVERERGEGFVAAAFTHRTSRALDPHLHTHVIVANLTRSGRDGRWRTLEGDALLRSYRLAAGYLYEAHVRYELTSRLGVDWGEPSKGMGEIRGVSASVLRHFSTRRQQIEQHLADHGSGGWRAAQVAAIITRDTKTSADLESLRSNWRAQAAEHGLTPGDLEHILGRARWQAMDHREQRATTRQLLSPRGLTEKDTTFSSAELVRAWAEAHRNGAQADTVLALVDQLARTPGVVHVADAAPGVPARLSTRDLIDAELAVLNAAKRGIHAGAPRAGVVDLMRATQAARVELGADQQAMIEHVTRSEDRIVCVVGHAGAGKTTALRVCADAFTQRGCVVLGAAPSGIAAQKLGQETGLRATTLHGLVADADLESGLPRGAVVIVDEASTADTRTLARLISHVDQARGKLVLVGDAAQLPSVGAGGLFAELVDRLGAVELASNRRQHHGRFRRIHLVACGVAVRDDGKCHGGSRSDVDRRAGCCGAGQRRHERVDGERIVAGERDGWCADHVHVDDRFGAWAVERAGRSSDGIVIVEVRERAVWR